MFRDFCLLQFAEEHLSSEEFLCFFYTWEKIAISLGKRQSNSKKIIQECISERIPVCIRPSGGKAVLHDGDICFTFISKQSNKDFGGNLLESYSLVMNYVLNILNHYIKDNLKENIQIKSQKRTKTKIEEPSFDCFASIVGYEGFIEHNSKTHKVLGSAQIMYANSFLQQGSLQIRIIKDVLNKNLNFNKLCLETYQLQNSISDL